MSERRQAAGRRAADRDRPLMLHGPVVRWIIIVQAIALLCSVAALAATIFFFSGRVDTATERADVNAAKLGAIQASRKGALFDNCKTLKGLIVSAAAQSPRNGRTRKQVQERTARYLAANDIADCHKYVRDNTALHVHVRPEQPLLVPPRIG